MSTEASPGQPQNPSLYDVLWEAALGTVSPWRHSTPGCWFKSAVKQVCLQAIEAMGHSENIGKMRGK